MIEANGNYFVPVFNVDCMFSLNVLLRDVSVKRRWVPGELLMFSGNGMLTGSATLGFLWCAISATCVP